MIVENKTGHLISWTVGQEVFTLFPGVNDPPAKAWDAMKALKTTQARLEIEDLIERDTDPLSKRPEKEAIRLTKNAFDAALLERWRTDDKRPAVQKAIRAQLDSLKLTDEERSRAKG